MLLLLALAIAGCGDGGGGDDSPPWNGETRVGSGWLTITVPTSGLEYSTTNASVGLAGSAYIGAWTYPNISTRVTWRNATTGQTGQATSYVEWIWFFNQATPVRHTWAASVPLVMGGNDITVTASGGGSSSGSDFIRVTRTPVPPSIIITVPTSNPSYAVSGLSVMIAGTASAGAGLASVHWQNSRTGESGVAAGLTSWTATVPLVQGDNLIVVTAVDTWGATATDSINVWCGPVAPAGLTAAAGDASVRLTWTSTQGVAYALYRARVSGVTKLNYAGLPGGVRIASVATPYFDRGLENYTTYHYVVTGTSNGVEGPESNEVSATPMIVPRALEGTAGDSSVTLQWASVPGASVYRVYRATYSGVSPSNYTWQAGTASVQLVDTDLTNGTDYFYVVTAVTSFGESPASSQLSITPIGPPDWEWQNPLPQGNGLMDVCVVAPGRGWAVGYKGTILSTENGGSTWQVQPSRTRRYLSAVSFADATTGWVVGARGTLLKTGDGGAMWVAQASGTGADIHHVDAVNALTAFAVTQAGEVLKTEDGVTWTTTAVFASALGRICMASTEVGWHSDRYSWLIRKTVDGGATWSSLGSPGMGISDMTFVDATHGWVCSGSQQGAIAATTDGGATWAVQPTGSTAYLYAVEFADAATGWAAGSGGSTGALLRTTDGGATWVAVGGVGGVLHAVSTSGIAFACAVGRQGRVVGTIDGVAWTNQTVDVVSGSAWAVDFVDESRGWIVGFPGVMLRTTDGGSTWHALPSGTTQYLADVDFVDATTGWVVGEGNTILHTSDGGLTWTPQSSGAPASTQFWDVSFVSATTGWVAGPAGVLFRTVDGGATWQELPMVGSVRDVKFVNTLTGWRATGGGVYKTEDAGHTWSRQIAGNFWKLAFASPTTGWAMEQGRVLGTNDGGATWTELPLGGPAGVHYRAMACADANSVIVGGSFGIVALSRDRGATWRWHESQSAEDILALAAVATNTVRAWAVGGNMILRMSSAP